MPKSYRLTADAVTFKETDTDHELRGVDGIANSGLPFAHWGELHIIDFEQLNAKTKVPLLVDHDRSKRAGFGTLSVTELGLAVNGSLLSNEHGREVAKDHDEGFPWELSVDVSPSSIEHLNADGTAVVNGKTLTGPIHILRGCTISEVSFTATAVDKNTHAQILAEEEEADNTATNKAKKDSPKPKESSMTDEEIQALKDKVTELETENTELKKQLKEKNDEANEKDVDATLSQAGFKRTDKGEWIGLSQATHKLLLSADPTERSSIVADLTPRELPTQLSTEQTGGSAGTQLSDEPEIVKQARAMNAANTGGL